MTKHLAHSELILNADGSIYHLNLMPDDIADTIIVVGDPNRVPMVSRHFDRIEVSKQKRELVTHTGYIGQKRMTVLSTGMGPGNIDIVMNELDALANIDFETRAINENVKSLSIIRLGTSGSLHPNLHPGEILVSQHAIGFDTTMTFYGQKRSAAFNDFMANQGAGPIHHYWASSSQALLDHICTQAMRGITLTAPGFYGAQNRSLRLPYAISLPFDHLHRFFIDGISVTNMEMESSCLYFLSELLGHKALSVNCILANRLLGTFANNPRRVVEKMIEAALNDIATL